MTPARRAPSARAVWPLFAVGFCNTVAIGARILIVPLHAAQLGASPATVGLLYAAYAGIGAFVSIPAGLLIDRHGSRWVLVGCLGLMVAAQLLATTDSIPLMLVSQVLAGVGWGTVPLAVVAAAIVVSRPDRMSQVIGVNSLCNQTGLMIGPALAGLLLTPLGPTVVLLLSALGPMLAAGVVLLVLRHERRPPALGGWWRSTREVLGRPGILPIALLAAAVGITWGSFQAYFAILGDRGLGLPAVTIGWLIGVAGFANTLSRLPAGRLLDRSRSKGVIVAASVTGFGAAMAVLPHLGGFLAVALLLAVAVPMIGVAIMGMTISAAELGGAAARARAIAVTSALFSTASGLAPGLLAPVMNLSFGLGFALVGIAGALMAGLAMLARRRVLRRAAAAAADTATLQKPAVGQ